MFSSHTFIIHYPCPMYSKIMGILEPIELTPLKCIDLTELLFIATHSIYRYTVYLLHGNQVHDLCVDCVIIYWLIYRNMTLDWKNCCGIMDDLGINCILFVKTYSFYTDTSDSSISLLLWRVKVFSIIMLVICGFALLFLIILLLFIFFPFLHS